MGGWRVTSEVGKFDQAIDHFASRVTLSDAERKRVPAESRSRAFWIAGVAQLDVVARVREKINAAIESGQSLEDFKKTVRSDLSTTTDAHIETVFRNATQAAYNAGRWRQMNEPETLRFRPYWLYDAVLDGRTCFAAGTRVTMADGSHCAIESIAPGDIVVSARGRARQVQATMVTPMRTWGEIHLSDGRRLRLTPNHPILTTRGWIRAKLLVYGDAVVLADQDLSILWTGVRNAAQCCPLLLGQVPTEWSGSGKAMHGLRQGVQASGEDRGAPVLQQAVQASISPSGEEVPGLCHGVCSEPGEQGLLQPCLQSHHENMRLVLQDVRMPENLREPRPVHGLLGRVQARVTTPGSSTGSNRANVYSLRGVIPCEAGRSQHAQGAVLQGVSTIATSKVHPMRHSCEVAGESVLLCQLLPQAYGRDHVGSSGSEGDAGRSNPIRSGSQNRAMVRRLPRGQSDLLGSGRGFLASRSEGKGTRRTTGPRDGETRIRGGEIVGDVGKSGPEVRDPRALSIWPVPSGAIIGAKTAAITAVHWELTDSFEPAYDLQVEDDKGFIANGVVVHNSDVCNGLNGTLLPATDPWWDSRLPPNHHRCRSSIRAVRKAEAEKRGITQAPSTDPVPAGFGLSPRVAREWRPEAGSRPAGLLTELSRKQASMAQREPTPALPKYLAPRGARTVKNDPPLRPTIDFGGRTIALTADQQQARQASELMRSGHSKRAGASYEARRDWLLWDWQTGQARTVALVQQAAQREFSRGGYAAPGTFQASDMTRTQRDIRRMHDETQAWFKSRNIKTVTVYRAVADEPDADQSVESWTTDKAVAERRARAIPGGKVLQTTLPVGQVLARSGAVGWVDGPYGSEGELLAMW